MLFEERINMAKVDPPPGPEELQKRKQPKYIIDPREVSSKDDERVRKWGVEVMKKHEFRLNSKFRDKQIVYRGEVDPEDIDIRNLYPFKDLNWIIFRDGKFWSLMLRSKEKLLALLTYAKI